MIAERKEVSSNFIKPTLHGRVFFATIYTKKKFLLVGKFAFTNLGLL
jgi:hypothetical protein